MVTDPPDELTVRRLTRELEAERERRTWADFYRFLAACRAYRAAVQTLQAEHHRAFQAGVLGPVRADREARDYEHYARAWAPPYPHGTSS